jgi:hypothetical protein
MLIKLRKFQCEKTKTNEIWKNYAGVLFKFFPTSQQVKKISNNRGEKPNHMKWIRKNLCMQLCSFNFFPGGSEQFFKKFE